MGRTTTGAARRRERIHTQGGTTLVEVLVALTVLGILASSGTLGLMTLMRTSTQADLQSRTDALLSGFGEALKQLDYVPCASGVEYEQGFQAAETASPADERLIQRTDASVEVDSVNAGDRCDAGIDAGVQVINVSARVGDNTRSAQIVKRDPNASPDGPRAVIDAPVPHTGAGDLLYTVALTAKGSTATLGILRLDWDCGPDAFTDATHARTYTTFTVDDPTVLCTYRAAAASDDVTVSLTVTDYSLATASATRTLTVPPWGTPPTGPTARFTFTQTSTAPQGPTYNPNTTSFDASTSMSPSGSDLTYSWTFGDSSSGELNTSTLLKPVHTYASPGSYQVTLTVTDDIGLYASESHTVVVDDSGKVAPEVVFTATPNTGVVSQTVSFNTTGTRARAAGATLSPASYQWTFGDGQVGSGSAPTHTYTTPGSFTVTLTVTDSLGNQAATARTVVFSAVPAQPPGFVLTDAEGEFWDDGHFYFAWTNIPRSPGDTISYEIEVKVVAGCVAFGTQTRTVTAGAAGTNQGYDFKVDWPASNVCLWSWYKTRVRTHRSSPTDGTSVTGWSSYSPAFQITHT